MMAHEDLPMEKLFCEKGLIVVSPDLYFSRRGSRVLIVEPETASWCVLNEPEWTIFCRLAMPAVNGMNNTFYKFQGGKSVKEIHFKDLITASEFYRLMYLLYRRNIISINGICYYQPHSLWAVQTYPHYYNLHMTEACNLACKYCRVHSKQEYPMMAPDTCRKIVRRLLEEIPSQNIIVGFHGGEPLLNMQAITAAALEAKEVAPRLGKTVRLSLQTNGTLLSPETVETLKHLGIEIGVSLDGPEHIHDRQRIDHSGRGSYQNVSHGLDAANHVGLRTGYLAVVHDPVHYVEVLDYLVRDRGACSVRINFTCFEGRAKETLDFEVGRGGPLAEGWLKMVDYAIAYQEETGIWLNIDDINLFVFHLLAKARPHMCYRSPCGIGNSILGFGYDGQIYLCDELVGDERFRVGSIHDSTPLKELLENSQIKTTLMNNRKVENIKKCSTCTWRRFHGSGCLNKSSAFFNETDREDPMCYFFQKVFEELMWRLWDNPGMANLAGYYKQYIDFEEAVRSVHT